MRDTLTIAKALADESRLRALALLEGRELCLCQIVEVLGLAPSTVSRHMALLVGAGLVASRKQGRWAYFRPAEDAPPAAAVARDWALEGLRRAEQTKADRQTLKQVLKIAPEELCCRQSGHGC